MKKNMSAAEYKEHKQIKSAALERESNLTLVSTSVAIVSFFLMLYIHNAVTTNFVAASRMLTTLELIFVAAGVACGAFAICKKKPFLWEYAAVCLVLAAGYYLLQNGVAGIPGMVKESADSFTVSPIAQKLSKVITTKNVIYALWALNVLYCVLTIVLHSAKYTKLKKGNN